MPLENDPVRLYKLSILLRINQYKQIDFGQKVPLRIERVKGSGIFANVEPRYLEAMSLLMSENLSASEAVKAVHIIDTVIWGQTRHLPLRLEKHYMNSFKLLKKFSSKKTEPSQKAIDITNDSLSAQVLLSEDIAVSCITPSSSRPDNITSELQKTVQSYIEVRKKDMGNTLPDPNCVHHNHHLLSIYCEGKVANEILLKKPLFSLMVHPGKVLVRLLRL